MSAVEGGEGDGEGEVTAVEERFFLERERVERVEVEGESE